MFISLILSLMLFISCSRKETDSHNHTIEKRDSLKTFNLTQSQKKIVDGAKKCLEQKFNYDNEMAYHVLQYKNGEFKGTKIFPNGDLDPTLGVCTDVTVRALRYGGVCDLQEEIYNDVKSNWNLYPMKRWGAKKPDTNIDHRRVPNQMIWFSRRWNDVTGDDYQPGDVIAWDMNNDGWGDHIGIISEKFVDNTPYLVHNFPDPGYVAEEDVLNRWTIIGHYRIRE